MKKSNLNWKGWGCDIIIKKTYLKFNHFIVFNLESQLIVLR